MKRTTNAARNAVLRRPLAVLAAAGFAVAVAMVHGPKPGGAKFGVARRNRDGRRHSAGVALTYLATERGGYTLQPVRGPDGSEWTTLAPASLIQVAQRIDQLIDSVRMGNQ